MKESIASTSDQPRTIFVMNLNGRQTLLIALLTLCYQVVSLWRFPQLLVGFGGKFNPKS